MSLSHPCSVYLLSLNCDSQGLPGLRSVKEIEGLTDENVATYLIRYGIAELPTHSNARLTRKARENLLKDLVGAPFPHQSDTRHQSSD